MNLCFLSRPRAASADRARERSARRVRATRCVLSSVLLAAGFASAASAQTVANWTATKAPASCLVVKAAPGSVDEIDVSSTAAGWAIVIDAATCPSNGAVTPVKAVPLGQAGAGQYAWSYAPPPLLWFQSGIVVLVSSTGPFTYTAQSTAFIMGVGR
jgi:hypothetical protein